MTSSDYCENCDYSPVSFGSRNKCPIHDKGLRDKKKIPLGRECEFYHNSPEVADAVLNELIKRKPDILNLKD